MVNLREYLLPFLLLSFLFIVLLTFILYRIMWRRLNRIIEESKNKEQKKEEQNKAEERNKGQEELFETDQERE